VALEPPEVEPPHRHGGGLPRWLEALVSISALVVSVSSIAIALHHGQIMEKLVQANSLPYLEAGTSNATPEGVARISVDLSNRGVGPAHETSLKLKVGDRYVRSFRELADTVLGSGAAETGKLHFYANQVPERFIPGGANQTVFFINRTPENADAWDALDASRRTWVVEYCYCSVFEECWAGTDARHHPVKACRRDEAHEFTP
jgi:hypothetical protein